MCNRCKDSDKSGIVTLIAVISGIVMAAAAVSAAVYFILKFVEKKKQCDYIECDCYGDFDDFDELDELDEAEDEPKAEEPAAEAEADDAE